MKKHLTNLRGCSRVLHNICISYSQLKKEGYSAKEIQNFCSSFKLFPTPFKGIYYVPTPEERKASYMEKPELVLTRAIQIYLKGKKFYYSCKTALQHAGFVWQPSRKTHVVSTISKRIVFGKRIERSEKKGTKRSKRIARILSLFGNEIFFHKDKFLEKSKYKETPYGAFATVAQAKKDEIRFHRIKSKKLA